MKDLDETLDEVLREDGWLAPESIPAHNAALIERCARVADSVAVEAYHDPRPRQGAGMKVHKVNWQRTPKCGWWAIPAAGFRNRGWAGVTCKNCLRRRALKGEK